MEFLHENLQSLGGLAGDSGKVVRQHYANAARYLDYRHYDPTVAEYKEAAQALPDYAQTLLAARPAV